MKCIKCGREHNDYHFRVLQVQTLHVRDFGKNSRIQALGDFEQYSVCAVCAEEKYAATMDIRKSMGKTMILWSLIMVLGAVLAVAFWKGEGVLRNAIAQELRKKYPRCLSQDASFQKYGFGATMVIIK